MKVHLAKDYDVQCYEPILSDMLEKPILQVYNSKGVLCVLYRFKRSPRNAKNVIYEPKKKPAKDKVPINGSLNKYMEVDEHEEE